MSPYLLDTDMLSLYQMGHPTVCQHCASHPPGIVAITVISVEEQLSGWYTRLRRAHQRDELAKVYQRLTNFVLFVSRLSILSFAEPAIQRYAQLQYLKARTCDVWTGPCFANAEMNLSGKNAVLAWKVDQGALDSVRLDGLSVVAVIAASDTLGLEQTGPAKAVVIVDAKATAARRQALVRLAQQQGGELVRQVVAVEAAPIDLT